MCCGWTVLMAARRTHHQGQPVPPAHPLRAGRTGEDRGICAAPLPVREHVHSGPQAGGGALEQRAARGWAQRAAPAGRLPPPGGPAVTHKIYRYAAHPSRLVLPFTAPTTAAGQ